MKPRDQRLRAIWKQGTTPVVYREASGKLLVKLPYATDNRLWLRNERRAKPEWQAQFDCWQVPKKWFEDTIQRALSKFGAVYVIQPYQELQKCASACWNAEGLECECSCMGKNHGAGKPHGRWYEITETFAFHWSERQFFCQLMKPND